MKVNIRKLSLTLLVLATIVPSYWFFSGRKILNLIYYVAVLLFLVQNILSRNRLKKTKYGAAGIYICSLILYCLQALLDTGMAAAINSVVSTVFIVIIVAENVRNEVDFTKAIDALLNVSLPLLLLGVVEAITGNNLFHLAGLTHPSATFYNEIRLGIHRVNSTFGHPIVYCNYLSMIAALCIYRLSCEIKKKKRNWLKFVYAMTILNVLLTVSRSVMLVFIGEQIVLLAIKGERWLTKRKIVIFLFAIVGALVSDFLGLGILDKVSDVINMILQVFGLGSDNYSSSFSSIGYSGIEGDRWKLYVWVAASIAGKWIFGQGTETAFSYMATGYREKTAIENYYLSTLFHHGVVGLAVLIIGLLGLLYYLLIYEKKSREVHKKLSSENRLTFNTSMICILLGEIVSYFMVDQSGEVRLFYICIGLVLAYNRIQDMKMIGYSEGATK